MERETHALHQTTWQKKTARCTNIPNINTRIRLQKPLVEPSDSLEEGLLLGELGDLLAEVAPDGETVLDAREQVDLVGLAGGLEDLLRLVALLDGEDGVGLGSGDRERTGDGSKLVLFDE